MTIELIAAPSPLGLRPPEPTAVPGTAKAPEALREAGLHRRMGAELGAIDGGVVLPGRYRDDWEAGAGRLRNQEALLEHAHRLAARIDGSLRLGHSPLILGGDCSLLVGAGLALSGRGAGLVHLDGHTDFRNPGNSRLCASLGGEDLAAAIGRHWPAVSDIDGRGPYFAPERTAHLGCREDDEGLAEVRAAVALVRTAGEIVRGGPAATAAAVLEAVDGRATPFWLHLDVDILDPAEMPAVDSPDSGGLTSGQLVELLASLAPHAIGAEVTIYDPDLDPDGTCAHLISDIVLEGLAGLGG